MVMIARGITTPRDSDKLTEIVRDMGELFRQHAAFLSGRIKELEERVQDLEGHAEHDADTTCGICVPDDEPETVGADEYGSGDIAISDFDGWCPTCNGRIYPGDEVRHLEGKWIHRDCN